MKLYGYWRSSAAYRVRIALNLKNIECEHISVHLVKDGGEQHKPNYIAMNPTELVPTLIDGDLTINQSMAMLEYLEEAYEQTPLLPNDIKEKAIVRALALDIACEVHPLNNLRVLQYLNGELGVTEQEKTAWYHHWIVQGFTAFEKTLEKTAGDFCFGDNVTIADLCLIPQVYNANRFKVDMSAFPLINKVVENCNKQPAFIDAAPENQADAT